MTNAILYLWQLPQNLLGLLLVAILRPEERYDWKGVRLCYSSRMRGGISLGKYVIVREAMKDYTGNTERHELGHAMQSQILGWLYLPVVGIPSLLWAVFYRHGSKRSYYWFYTERWADAWGGVERDE